MSTLPAIDPLDLSALLCSRICHDLISPVGAVANGLEVLADDDDPEMREHAMALVQQSARQASAKLTFARLAFGAAGSAASVIEMSEVRAVADGFTDGGKTALRWEGNAGGLPKDYVKLLLNLLLIALNGIPRGGEIAIRVEEGERPVIRLDAEGPKARLPEEAARYLDGGAGGAPDDARSVQPYFTARLAEALGRRIAVTVEGEERLRLSVED